MNIHELRWANLEEDNTIAGAMAQPTLLTDGL
jgi:hypothetical protein